LIFSRLDYWLISNSLSDNVYNVSAVEILAIAIRNQDDIKGIKINDLETKLLQFADDTTVVLSDLDSARALFVLLDCFEKVSGLKLNVAKTEAMWIGSLQNCGKLALSF